MHLDKLRICSPVGMHLRVSLASRLRGPVAIIQVVDTQILEFPGGVRRRIDTPMKHLARGIPGTRSYLDMLHFTDYPLFFSIEPTSINAAF